MTKQDCEMHYFNIRLLAIASQLSLFKLSVCLLLLPITILVTDQKERRGYTSMPTFFSVLVRLNHNMRFIRSKHVCKRLFSGLFSLCLLSQSFCLPATRKSFDFVDDSPELMRASRQVRWPAAGGEYNGDSGGNYPTTTSRSTTTSSSDSEDESPALDELSFEEQRILSQKYYPASYEERSRIRGKVSPGQRVKSSSKGTGNPAIVGPVVPWPSAASESVPVPPWNLIVANRPFPQEGYSNFLPPNGDDCRQCSGPDCFGCDLPGPRCMVLRNPQEFIEILLECCDGCSDDVRLTGCKCNSQSVCESFMRRYPEWRQFLELQKRKKLMANRGPVYGPFGNSGNNDNYPPPPPPPGSGPLATSLGVGGSWFTSSIRHQELRSTDVNSWPEPEESTVEFVRRSVDLPEKYGPEYEYSSYTYEPSYTEFVFCPLEEYSENIHNL